MAGLIVRVARGFVKAVRDAIGHSMKGWRQLGAMFVFRRALCSTVGTTDGRQDWHVGLSLLGCTEQGTCEDVSSRK